MSQAEALLNSLDEPMLYTATPSGEPHIVINRDRTITVPDELKHIAVQFDHNIETVTFDCPRYWDNNDLSKMHLYINYRCPDGYKDRYSVKNLRVDTSDTTIIHFDWTVSGNVTRVKGNISFLVCGMKVDSEGLEELHWNSRLNQDLIIDEGMECDEDIMMHDTDTITHLLTRMADVEAIATPEAMQTYTNTWLDANHDQAIAEIEDKGAEVLASIPEDYTETYNMARDTTRIKANAIVSEAEGDPVVITDSADSPMIGLNLYGKTTQLTSTGAQLFDANTDEKFSTNASYSVDKDTITYVSNETYTVVRLRVPREPLIAGKTYVLECDSISEGLTCQLLGNHVAAGESLIDARLMNGNTRIEFTIPENVDMSLFDTFNEGIAYLAMSLFVSESAHIQTTQIVKGLRLYSVDNPLTQWEAYSGGVESPSPFWSQDVESIENPTIYTYGANLFPIRDAAAVGITGVPQSDGSVHYTGTGTENAWHAYQQCPIYRSGTYTLTVETANKTSKGSLIQIFEPSNMVGRTWANTLDKFTCTFEARAGGFVRVNVGITAGVAVDATFKIMLNPGGTALDWEPYVPVQSVEVPFALHAIPVSSGGNYTDSDGQQWVCDELDFERGVHIQRLAHYVFNGSEDEEWSGIYTYSDAVAKYVNIHLLPGSEAYTTPLFCNRSVRRTWNAEYFCFINEYDRFVVGGSAFGDALDSVQTFRDHIAVNPIELVYQLKNPIETPVPADEMAKFEALRTNYLSTTILNDSGAHMAVKYNTDLKSYINALIANL